MADFNKRIPVTEEGKDIADESKRDDESWDDFIRRCAENPPEVKELVEVSELDLDGGLSDDDFHDVERVVRGVIREELR